MASDKTGRIVLMPILPRFANAILTGEKRVEFRKWRFSLDVREAVIYATSPVCRILGYFQVKYITVGTPDELWLKYHCYGGIGRGEFNTYYEGTSKAVALVVGVVTALNNPLRLTSLDPDLAAPQSFKYLSDSMFESIKTLAYAPPPDSSLRSE